jgi:D-alanyl-lipoteichoic acid acyltransferase DltB (MBOAT superfamily)
MAFVPKYLLILVFTIAIDFWAGIALENSKGKHRKYILFASLVANLGILFVFKYFNFFSETISALGQTLFPGWSLPLLTWALPIGLSFHTFQAMAYTIEVYYGRQRAERNWAIYALYVLFYPQLVAGPIERPQNLLPQFHQHHPFNSHSMVLGLRLMLWGLFKKVVIADRLTVLVDSVYQSPGAYPGPILALAVLLFSFQIYCDFSGYTDIARGAAQVMGIRFMKNFDRPYLSTSVTEFWKRWHISLSSWFRDYVFIPLGGNRVSRARSYLNLLIVFLISGFWHGANWTFLIWGLIHGIIVSFEKATGLNRVVRYQGFRLILTFGMVSLAWVFFRAPSFQVAWNLLGGLTQNWTGAHFQAGINRLADGGFFPADLILSLFFCAFLIAVELVDQKQILASKINKAPVPARLAMYYAGICFILLLGKFSREQFIYFQF